MATLRLWRVLGTALFIGLGLPSRAALSESSAPRPQTPLPPFSYQQREVTFTNTRDGVTLNGTLTAPNVGRPHPAVVLIPGSGEVDRDGTAAGHKPFLVIADHLTREGIAVLRFDARALQPSYGATLEDIANDVLAGLAFLKQQPEIDGRRIGVVAHSLGGLIAPMAASRADVTFAVLLAGVALPVRDLAQLQRADRLRAKGLPEDEVRRKLDASLTLYDRLATGDLDTSLDVELREFINLQLPAELNLSDKQFDEIVEQERTMVRSRYYRFLHAFDPSALWRQVKCPVLALNGSLDRVVSARENLAALEKAAREGGNSGVTVMEIYGLNHFFQRARTGNPLEVAQIEETVSPAILELLANWIRARVALKRTAGSVQSRPVGFGVSSGPSYHAPRKGGTARAGLAPIRGGAPADPWAAKRRAGARCRSGIALTGCVPRSIMPA